MWNAGLDESQAGIKIFRRNINNLRYAGDTTLMAQSEEKPKSLLMKLKEENEKFGLKLNIQKTKIMASGPFTSWQIEGGKVEAVTNFIFLGSKITSEKLLQSSRGIPLLTKVPIVKVMVFPVVMNRCESWTIKKGECQRIDAFELWCWRRLLRVRWTARRANQSIFKEINPEYSLKGLMLKLQYSGHLMQRADSWKRPWCWERLRAWGEGDNRGWDGRMASLTCWTWVWVDSMSWWWTGRPWCAVVLGVAKSRTRLSDWIELKYP